MFSKLGGLPLVKAGAFLQQSGVGIGKYLEFYEQQWKELMDSQGPGHTPLQEYPNGSEERHRISLTKLSGKKIRLR